MPAEINPSEEAQLNSMVAMFEIITQSQPNDIQSLEILKEAYFKLGKNKEMISASKRISRAYANMGQLTSALMELETVLQLFPDDPEARQALAEIETKTNPYAERPKADESTEKPPLAMSSKSQTLTTDIEDGRKMMHKIFVEGKCVNESDFNSLWPTPPKGDLEQTVEPLLLKMAEKNIMPIEKSLKLLSEKSRAAFLPLDKYDVDMDTARLVPKTTCWRWCVLPFDKMSKTVLVATANPFNIHAAREIEMHTACRVHWYLAVPADIIKILQKIYR